MAGDVGGSAGGAAPLRHGVEPEPEVGGRAGRRPEEVAVGEDRGKGAGGGAEAAPSAVRDEVGEARVEAERGEGPAVRGRRAVGGEGAEVPEERAGVGEGGCGGRVEPAERAGVARAPEGEFEGEPGEVGVEEFGRVRLGEPGVVGARPEPVADAGAEPPRPPAPLVRRLPGDGDGGERRHPRPRRVPWAPAVPPVHDDADALDRQARLGEARGEDDLARAGGRRPERGVLGGEVEVAVENVEGDAVRERRPEPVGHAADLAHAGQEREHVAVVVGERVADRAGDERPEFFDRASRAVYRLGGREVVGLDGEAPPLAPHDGRPEPRAHPGGVEGRAHDEEAEVGAEGVLGVEREGEAEVGVQAPLVELVKDQRGHPIEAGVVLEQPRENPLRHHFDARPARDLRLHPHPVPDGLPHRLAKQGRHPPGRRTSGEPPGLQHHDAPVPAPRGVEQGERHERRLARARRRFEHGPVARGERPEQRRQDGDEGEVGEEQGVEGGG